MSDVRIEREFPVTQARLFAVVSTHAGLLQWWGHEGWKMHDEALDFSREGPWHCAMISEDGSLFQMSGQVTKVQPIEMVGFTWRWDEPPQMRGNESHVTFTIQETERGAKLVIDHRELASEEMAANHARGWGGPLAKLEALLGRLNV